MKDLNNCGCCEGVSVETPILIDNRSGLSAISYRTGIHKDFLASLLAGLTTNDLGGLQKLTTRSEDDYTIALLDAFSVVADILTFYQERIVNEAYLPTAIEKYSLIELSRLIGYELRPGVAATTYLSFTAEENSMQPSQEIASGIKSSVNAVPNFQIPVGTKVQSIPEQDEKPQIFETLEELEASAKWNAMEVQTSQAQTNVDSKTEIFLQGLDNLLKAGDTLLIVKGVTKKLERIFSVELLDDLKITKVVLEKARQSTNSFFIPMLNLVAKPFYFENIKTLDETVIGELIKDDININELDAIKNIQGWSTSELAMSLNNFQFTIPDETKVFVFRKRASVFGYNAPSEITINNTNTVVFNTLPEDEEVNIVTLDTEYPEVVAGSEKYIAIQNGTNEQIHTIDQSENVPVNKYGMSGKSTKLTFTNNNKWWGEDTLKGVRPTTVHIQSEKLKLSRIPITEPLKANDTHIILSKFVPDLQKDKTVLISGELSNLPGVIRNEIHVLKDVYVQQGFTTIELEKPLQNSFIRKTVRINANVALASHGETVNEILGSGNAALKFQKFYLKHNPLTYISSDSSTGTKSSLEIRVNNILWTEVDSFYGKSGKDHIYITRRSEEGNTMIKFGNGITGSRLSTGTLNVKATYRKGLGASGMLKANQLSMLVEKTINLKAVNNPLRASGAQDSESIEEVRSNANLTMYTLGRIVSLQDYEDFARAFAGISKAKAIWTWHNNRKAIHITISGVDGANVEEGSILYNNLQKALSLNAVEGTHVRIDSFKQKYFTLGGGILVDPTYEFDLVREEVVKLLRQKYSFDERDFGQAVYKSEVINTIQSVEGVISVDLDSIHFLNQSSTILASQLTANLTTSGDDNPKPSELLTLANYPITFNQLS